MQWIAPLASEAPELLVAGLYAWRLNTSAGLGTLVSSKVNQWTLLVGTLPIVFAVAAGGFHGLPLDTVQREELFLTAAQSFFAVAVISNLSMSLREAGILFGLFWFQFILGGIVPESLHGVERIGVGILYLVLGVVGAGARPRAAARAVQGRVRPPPTTNCPPNARPTPPGRPRRAGSLGRVDPRAFLRGADRRPRRRQRHWSTCGSCRRARPRSNPSPTTCPTCWSRGWA